MQLPVQNQIQQQSPEVYFIPPFVFPTVYEEEPPTVSYHSQTDDLPVYGLLLLFFFCYMKIILNISIHQSRLILLHMHKQFEEHFMKIGPIIILNHSFLKLRFNE